MFLQIMFIKLHSDDILLGMVVEQRSIPISLAPDAKEDRELYHEDHQIEYKSGEDRLEIGVFYHIYLLMVWSASFYYYSNYKN